MAEKTPAAKPRTLEDVVKQGKDDVVLADLGAYIFDGDMSMKKIDVSVSFTLAHGKDMRSTPKTLGELRKDFKNGLSYENPMGEHDRSHVILNYTDPITGKGAVMRLPISSLPHSSEGSRG